MDSIQQMLMDKDVHAALLQMGICGDKGKPCPLHAEPRLMRYAVVPCPPKSGFNSWPETSGSSVSCAEIELAGRRGWVLQPQERAEVWRLGGCCQR